MSLRVVFLGSKPIGYQCLEYLIREKHLLGLEIVGVCTRLRQEFGTEHDLTRLAMNHGLPLFTSLEDLPDCEIIYSVQHHELLRQHHINKARIIAVNLHLAPLPEYRGCNQFSFAILDKAKEFGVTLHEIDSRIDHGPILFEKRFPIQEYCWVDELYDSTVTAALSLFKETLPDLLQSNYKKVYQDTLVGQRITSLHFREEIQALKNIDLNQSAEAIQLAIRATYMPGFELPHCIINGEKVYFNRNK